ncbi:MAG: ankyrin repeat domain-containing protein [Planctomycetaceae bacterium]|nr:ankyrin repeat domain-containing protein [Planctomycetaceae bacterium]
MAKFTMLLTAILSGIVAGDTEPGRPDLRLNNSVGTHVTAADVTLSEAVMKGDEETAVRLIADGARTDVRTKFGSGLLEYSIATGSETVVDALIQAGADLNRKDHFGNTPLFTAALWDKTRLFR